MSESDSWSEHDDPAVGNAVAIADDIADDIAAPPVAEQMQAATRSLRAHLSLVRDLDDAAPSTASRA